MSLPDRHNPYSFETFLDTLHGFDFYADDPFLQRVLKHFAGADFAELDGKIRAFSANVSFRWRPLTDTGGHPRNLPYVGHFDAYNRRIDRVVRSAETVQLENEVFGFWRVTFKHATFNFKPSNHLLHHRIRN